MIYLFFVLTVMTEFLINPHWPGFTPVFGALLFCGARLKKRDAIWFPILILAVADVIMTTQFFHMAVKWQHAFTLLAFAAMARIGGMLRNNLSVPRFLGCSATASIAYWVISNLGVWLGWGIYPHTREGLFACYVAALPYLRSSALSTLGFAAVLFGAYEWMRRRQHEQQFGHSPAHAR